MQTKNDILKVILDNFYKNSLIALQKYTLNAQLLEILIQLTILSNTTYRFTKCSKEIILNSNSIYQIIQLYDGRIVSASRDATIRVFNPKRDFLCTHILKRHNNVVSCILQLRNRMLVSGSFDSTIIIWNPYDDFKQIKKIYTQCCISLLELRNNMLAVGSDVNVTIYSIKHNYMPVHVLNDVVGQKAGIIKLKGNRIAIANGRNFNISIYNNFTLEKALSGHTAHIAKVIQLRDGKLASASWDRSIIIWDARQENNKVLAEHSRPVYLVFQGKGGLIYSSSQDKTLRIWTDSDYSCIKVINLTMRLFVFELICIRDGKLVGLFGDFSLGIINDNGEIDRYLDGHKGLVSSVIELHDGRILTCSHDKSIRLWE
jgi:WD40 repeat protein